MFTNANTHSKVLRAAAASIDVLKPGGRWRIAVPDAYFPKYLNILFWNNNNIRIWFVVNVQWLLSFTVIGISSMGGQDPALLLFNPTWSCGRLIHCHSCSRCLFQIVLFFVLPENTIVLGSWLWCGGTWVPRCERPVPQSRLHRGRWKSEQVNSPFKQNF